MIGIRNVKKRFPNGFKTLQSNGENEYGKTGHSKIVAVWGAIHDHFLNEIVLGHQYYTISQALITRRAMHLTFGILINAFT